MRILLANHAPFDAPEAGAQTRELAHRWRGAGEQVRCLIVDRLDVSDGGGAQQALDVERVLCRPDDPRADLPFGVPCLRSHVGGGPTFGDLTERQLACYREALRRALDGAIAGFDPHLIHVQHIWVTAHLALETGVPYLLTAYGPELAAYRANRRFRRFADEAAQNAGRIVAADEAVREEVVALFGELNGRIVVPPPAIGPETVELSFLRSQYRAVLVERLGAVPEL